MHPNIYYSSFKNKQKLIIREEKDNHNDILPHVYQISKIKSVWWVGGRFKREGTYVYLRLIHVDILYIQYSAAAAAAAKSLQSCPTLRDPTDGSAPGSPVPGILQARTLEWVAISFSNVWKWKVKVKSLSRVRLLETPWTAAYQIPPSMGFSRQEYWSGVPLPSPTILPKHALSLRIE